MKYFKLCLLTFIALIAIYSCKKDKQPVIATTENYMEIQAPAIPDTNGFDFPVGKPDAKGYYNAQKFGKNNHLGEDWNAITGGNTDLGDPIYAIANGKVTIATDLKGGWGNVIRIVHKLSDGSTVESVYAHCDRIFVAADSIVTKGTKIGTIGTAHGNYLAHLHFEMRDIVGMEIGPGYSTNTRGYLDPTAYIIKHR